MTNTTQVRILYIEDDPLIGELFKTVVEENGYSVDLAYNGKHGLSLLKKNNYDVLATDYDLPDLTGLEICREVLSKQPNFPIVMVTGKGGEGIAAEALNLGVSNYIQKDSQSTFVNLLPAVISKLVARSRELADHQASEDLFRTMVSVSPTAIHFHQNMKIVFANPAMVKLLGANSEADIIGLSALDLVHSEFKDTITQRILSITKTGKEAGLFEQKYVRHDGTEIDVEAQGTAIKYRGEPAVMVMSRDITKRKNAELELVESYGELERRVEERTLSLAASEERFRTLIDLANYGILVHRNRVPIYANDALAKLYEYASPDEILALGSMRLLTHPDLQGKNYEKIMRGEILPEDYETMGVKKNGVTFWENRRSFLINWDGEKAVCSIRSDIDQRKKTEDALLGAKVEAEALSQVKTDFLANMSHELRTPLNAIIGFSEAILGKTFGFIANERQEEYIQDIHRSGNHLLQLINDILDVTAIEEGKLELQDNHIEIRILIDDISKMIQSRANSGKVTLSTQVDESVFALRGDERRLKQILLNLVSNAVKFTPDGGTVSLECQLEKAGQLKFVVADSGIGMSKEGIKTALEPFGQVDEIINGKYEGTGLGLPLTVQLVESHGGTLEIESELRKGTTVTVLIPKERVVR